MFHLIQPQGLFLLSLLGLFALGCKKPCKLPGQQIGQGLVIREARVVQAEPTVITGDMRTTFRIDSLEQNEFSLMVEWDDSGTLADIDFTNFTVLGAFASGAGCEIIYDRVMICNDVEQKCLYQIEVKSCGNCEMLSESMNWILVPKIDPAYTVHFVIK